MNQKRFPRALMVALVTACFGLLCCVSLFFVFHGLRTGTALFPALLFVGSLLAALLFLFIKKLLTRRQ